MLVKDLMEKLSKMDADKEIKINEDAFDDDLDRAIAGFEGIKDEDFVDGDGEPVADEDLTPEEQEEKAERERHVNFLKGMKNMKKAGIGKSHSIYAPGGNPNDSGRMGGYLSDETPTENRKKRVIAIVKFARDGVMYGSIDDVDMAKYDEYKAWYDEHSEELKQRYSSVPQITEYMDEIDSEPEVEEQDYDRESFEESADEESAKKNLEKVRKDYNESLKDEFDLTMDMIKNL